VSVTIELAKLASR